VLVHALASQWVGVNVIPKEARDMWAITGVSGFMRDTFMRKLAGNNEYRYQQKLASEQVFEQDVERYSIHQLGAQLDIDPSEYDFMALKSAVVLFILDRRLTKASGAAGVGRIITRLLLNAKTGDLQNGELSTDWFHRLCEKLGHTKLDAFFRQWVYGAGCPLFKVNQRFNKKKLVVEMNIYQTQRERKIKPELQPSNFMREAKEQVSEEIPYNTKYKRLKRSKRAKERAMATNGTDFGGEAENDVLLYCLGDVLQSEDEVKDWRLVDWGKEEEDRMGQESYEWIRMDADFEWIGKIDLIMPIYMYVSQLQQDRDVVAQYEVSSRELRMSVW
jgi:transcription initiation factor TFIID subunit 2